jgi:molybdate transport system permease protein
MTPLLDTILISLQVSLCATFIVMVVAVFLAMWLASSRSKIAKLVELLVYVPMAMPPVALGYGLLLCLGQNSVIGQFFHDYFGIDIAFTYLGAVIASVMVSLGIGVRTVRLALEDIEQRQIDSAYILGARKSQVLIDIVLPQLTNAILGGAVLVFIRALSEFGATMVLVGTTLGGARTLAVAIWVGMETPGQERHCLILVVIAVLISGLALIAVEILVPRRFD